MTPIQQVSACKRVLIAEDEEHIAKLVQFRLGKEGFQVTVAPNGQVAVDRLAEGSWDLLILDVMMPLKNGWEVLEHVRALPALANLPVLMLTAKGQNKDMAKSAELGADHYLKKPFDLNELVEVVQRLSRGRPK